MAVFKQKKSGLPKMLPLAISFAVFVLMIIWAVTGSMSFSRSLADKQPQYIADTIRRYAVQCYAIEGTYPPDIDYLVSNYGLTIDRENYICHYENIGGNLLPQINVFAREGGR